MEKYEIKLQDEKYIIKDIENNETIIFQKHKERYGYDEFIIKSSYTFDFIKYVCEELKKNNELKYVMVEYESEKIGKYLLSMGLIPQYTQYCLKLSKKELENKYYITTIPDDEAKKYLIDNLNEMAYEYDKYNNHPIEEEPYNNNLFVKFDYNYKIYKKNNKIVGMSCFQISDNDKNHYENSYYNYANKICIIAVFGESDTIIKDIYYDLYNTYNKDIIVIASYSRKGYKELIGSLNNCFDYVLYSIRLEGDVC